METHNRSFTWSPMRWIARISFVILVASCKHGQSAADVKVVGGSEATLGLVPASVRIPNCSAARVSERHLLTAAHCVLDQSSSLSPLFAPGMQIRIDYGIKLRDQQYFMGTIERVFVHSSYFRLELKSASEVVDVALIELSTSFPDQVKVAAMSPTSLVGQEESVLFTGYGCERLPAHMRQEPGTPSVVDSRELEEGEENLRLKIAKKNFAGYQDANGILLNEVANPLILGSEEFSGCPGDSGSAVYRSEQDLSDPHLTVVGVNSRVGPFRTAFARVDDDPEFSVHSCLSRAITGAVATPDTPACMTVFE